MDLAEIISAFFWTLYYHDTQCTIVPSVLKKQKVLPMLENMKSYVSFLSNMGVFIYWAPIYSAGLKKTPNPKTNTIPFLFFSLYWIHSFWSSLSLLFLFFKDTTHIHTVFITSIHYFSFFRWKKIQKWTQDRTGMGIGDWSGTQNLSPPARHFKFSQVDLSLKLT